MNLVSLERLRPSAIFDLRYATPNNISGKVLGDDTSIARLDMAAATRLFKAATEFSELGYRLVLWDAFRSEQAQQALRAVTSDSTYVLEQSQHSLGRAVDITLADTAGRLLDMGTDHDEFSERAHVNAVGLTELQESNRFVLATTMGRHGFVVWPYEWWHFDFDPETIRL